MAPIQSTKLITATIFIFILVPGAPINVILDQLNPSKSAIQVTWSPPVSKNGIILEYQVNYVGYKAEDKPPVRNLHTVAHPY